MGKLIDVVGGLSESALVIDADLIVGVGVVYATCTGTKVDGSEVDMTEWSVRVFFSKKINTIIHYDREERPTEIRADCVTLFAGCGDSGEKNAKHCMEMLTRQINKTRRRPLLRRILGV